MIEKTSQLEYYIIEYFLDCLDCYDDNNKTLKDFRELIISVHNTSQILNKDIITNKYLYNWAIGEIDYIEINFNGYDITYTEDNATLSILFLKDGISIDFWLTGLNEEESENLLGYIDRLAQFEFFKGKRPTLDLRNFRSKIYTKTQDGGIF